MIPLDDRAGVYALWAAGSKCERASANGLRPQGIRATRGADPLWQGHEFRPKLVEGTTLVESMPRRVVGVSHLVEIDARFVRCGAATGEIWNGSDAMPHHTLPALLRVGVVGLLLAALQAGGCKPAPDPAPAVAREDMAALDRLLHLMGRRLAVMHHVARWKWNEGKPILDPGRERELLDGVVERGRAGGLDPGLVRAFFAAQMEAARRVQQADFDRWREDGRGRFNGTEGLVVLRQRIDELNGELLEALDTVTPLLERRAFQEALVARAAEALGRDGLESVSETAISPLRRETLTGRQ